MFVDKLDGFIENESRDRFRRLFSPQERYIYRSVIDHIISPRQGRVHGAILIKVFLFLLQTRKQSRIEKMYGLYWKALVFKTEVVLNRR